MTDIIQSMRLFFGDKVVDLPFAKSLIYLGDADLKASRLLYDNNLYAHAIYNLQQSVEKVVKGTFLLIGAIDKKDLYGRDGINHETPTAFLKVIRQKFWSDVSAALNNKYTKGEDLDEFISSFTPEQFAKMSSEDIQLIMNSTKGERGLEYGKKEIANIEVSITEAKKRGEQVRELPAGFETKALAFGQSLSKLLGLSIITFPHWEFTRYPDKLVRPEHYNKQLGIIHKYEFLENELKLAITSIKDMLILIESLASKN